MDPFIGEVRLFPWGFTPKGWAPCNGQMLPVNQNAALFSLLGTYYGGDGRTTFGLPNLQGRTPISFGSGGGESYTIGQTGGSETVGVTVTNLPAHTHLVNAVGKTQANQSNASNAIPATAKAAGTGPSVYIYAPTGGSTVTLAAASLSTQGGGTPHNNMQPFLVLNYCIALTGIFPSRN